MSREARASFQMIEMYLDPEIEVMWAQTGQGIAQAALQPNLEAVHAAQTLLQDILVTEDVALRHQVHLPLLLPDTVVTGLMSRPYSFNLPLLPDIVVKALMSRSDIFKRPLGQQNAITKTM